jgi:hypothetical protein
MAAGRAGVSLTVLVRGLTCDCSPKEAQHLRTIGILQADIVKKKIGHSCLSPDHRTPAVLAAKHLIAKTLYDKRGGVGILDPMVSSVKNW